MGMFDSVSEALGPAAPLATPVGLVGGMIPAQIDALLGGGLSNATLGGGGINSLYDAITGGASGRAQDASRMGVEAFLGVGMPDIEKMKVDLEKLVQVGQLTPEEAQTILQEKTELQGITLDPKLKQAQMEALASLQDIGQNKGVTDMDRAQLAEIANQENIQARGAREAIMQNAQARGMGGSGMELLSQLQNEQDRATRQSSRDTSVAGMAQQRALQALQGAGSLGGQIGAQEFGQQAQVAGAQDAINKFNTANLNTTNLTNVGARNAAQEANLREKQRVADSNVGLGNQQKVNNANLLQQDYENKLKKASGLAGQYQSQAQQYNQQATGIQSLLGTGVSAAAAASDVNLKKDVEPFDASEFLDSITGYKFKYKDPGKFGEGENVGPMAQDLERTPAGAQMVLDTPEGKMVDYNKAGGPLFASLANLNERIKKVEGDGDELAFLDKAKGKRISDSFKKVT